MGMPVILPAILTSTPVLILLGYAAFVVLLQVALQPMRLRMVDLAESMLAEGHWNKDQREQINLLLDRCASLSISIMLPIAAATSLLMDVMGVDTHVPGWMRRLDEDERFHALISRFIVSVLGANPIAAMFTVPLMALSLLIGIVRSSRGYQRTIEEPIAILAQRRELA